MCFICAQSCRLGPCGPSILTRPHMAGAGLCLESRYGSWHRTALLSRTGLRHLCRHTRMPASTKLGSQYSPKALFLWPPGTTSCRAQVTASGRPVVVTSIICHPLWCQCHVIYCWLLLLLGMVLPKAIHSSCPRAPGQADWGRCLRDRQALKSHPSYH